MAVTATRPIVTAINTRRSGVEVRAVLWAVLGLSLVAHLALILTTQGAAADINNYLTQAQTVFDHRNVYDATLEYPYPPVWIWLVGLARWFSLHFGVPFFMVVKLPGTMADFGIALLLYDMAKMRRGSSYRAVLVAALYALNPLVLLITAGHGQFDALVIFFLLLATRIKRGGALALGGAIALKAFPALFLPYFLRGPNRRWTFILALLPITISVVLYSLVFGFSIHMLANVIGYRSGFDFGWLFLILRLPAMPGALSPVALMLLVLGLSLASELAIIGFALIIPSRWFFDRPAHAVAVVFAAWFATTPTMAAQYTLWIVPFLCLTLPAEAILYSLCALLGVATFYVQTHAGGALPPLPTPMLDLLSAPFLRMAGVLAIILCSAHIAVRLRAKRETSPELGMG